MYSPHSHVDVLGWEIPFESYIKRLFGRLRIERLLSTILVFIRFYMLGIELYQFFMDESDWELLQEYVKGRMKK